jgi:protein disulfide-isomerase A6
MLQALLLSCAVLLGTCSSNVVELTPANFDELTRNGDDWMLEFYAPWCSHCKSLAPHYAAAADALVGKVRFGMVDGSQFRSLSLRFSIGGYPTVFHLNGKTGDVRKAAIQFTSGSIIHFATSAWSSYPASPFLSSPCVDSHTRIT